MTKFYGTVGFVGTVDDGHGVYSPADIERPYTGDLVRNNRRWQAQQESINDDLTMSNEISILADDFLIENDHMIKYVTINGGSSKWKVNSIQMDYPRVKLQIGGVYNG